MTFTLKTPLKKALFAMEPGVTPAMSTLPALPGTKPKGQGIVPLEGVTPGGHLLVSMVTVTRPAVSVEEVMKLPVEVLVTFTPRTTPEPPGVTRAKCP